MLEPGPLLLTSDLRRIAAHKRFNLPATRYRYFAGGGGASIPAIPLTFKYPSDIISSPSYLKAFPKAINFAPVGFSSGNNTRIHDIDEDFAITVHGSGKPYVRGSHGESIMLPLHLTALFQSMPMDSVVDLTKIAADSPDKASLRAMYQRDTGLGRTKLRESNFGKANPFSVNYITYFDFEFATYTIPHVALQRGIEDGLSTNVGKTFAKDAITRYEKKKRQHTGQHILLQHLRWPWCWRIGCDRGRRKFWPDQGPHHLRRVLRVADWCTKVTIVIGGDAVLSPVQLLKLKLYEIE